MTRQRQHLSRPDRVRRGNAIGLSQRAEVHAVAKGDGVKRVAFYNGIGVTGRAWANSRRKVDRSGRRLLHHRRSATGHE